MKRLFFFVEDRLAQLRWTRDDLACAGGPAPSTLRKAGQRGGGLTARTLARLDFALGWQEGSAQRALLGQSPSVRISEQLSAYSSKIDAAMREAEREGTGRCATELKNFLLDVAQRLGDFYTDPVEPVRDSADAGCC
ncbi:hypothetical protein C0J29_30560 (plasmid) [Mycobacterium paragordonae]|nr:hypothetical protein [Mycobacterium paragordonae]AYE99315.1 hypothetical protein C0J29_30560 [Mycobacterium paragordonae]PJE25176.1 MAG: hypothetical protein CK431_02190 [Mycobacterium sp.]GFG82929.1 hypothetical protein MPRG_62050 [Mycobacterium paragordonae]